MADSIREQIMKRVVAVLQTITTGNGYDNTIQSVQRFKQGGNVYVTVPLIVIHEGEDRAKDGPEPLTDHHLDVALEVVTRHNEAVDTTHSSEELGNSLKKDLITALMPLTVRNWTSGASVLAIDTAPLSCSPLMVEPGQPDLTFFVETTIHYRHKNTDPTLLS